MFNTSLQTNTHTSQLDRPFRYPSTIYSQVHMLTPNTADKVIPKDRWVLQTSV